MQLLGGWLEVPTSLKRRWHCAASMYVVNHAKIALGLEGNTDPTQAELEAAVTATGYTGYVSMEYDLQKTPEPEPDQPEGNEQFTVPTEDMIRSFNKEQLKELVAKAPWCENFDPNIFKGSVAMVRQAVMAAFKLASAG